MCSCSIFFCLLMIETLDGLGSDLLLLLTFIFLISTCAPSLLHLGRPANVCLDDDDAGMATILS